MVTMTTEAPEIDTDPVHPVRPGDAPPVHRAPVHGGAPDALPVHVRPAVQTPGAPVRHAPVHQERAPADPPKARTGARVLDLVRTAMPRVRRTGAPGDDAPVRPGKPAAPPVQPAGDAPVHPAPPRIIPAPPAGAPPRRRAGKVTTTNPTLGEQWGKLTHNRGPWATRGLRVLALLIAFALVGVVVAPPALSAHDIISWAQSHSTDAGLGLSPGWAWVAFLALDFAAGVCVLICLFSALINEPAGKFGVYVWAFALATAYANYSFGSRPNAPGDAFWFFPAMSLLGPLLLHSVLSFLRKRIAGAQGNKRGKRPTFPLVDWLPVVGTPQDTYGAWRTGAMLGIEVPDAALWAYRAVSLEANWIARWGVRRLVRTQQTGALRTMMDNPDVALAIPGLVPSGAFVSLVQPAEDAPTDAPEITGAPTGARTSAPARPALVAPTVPQPAPAGAPAVPQGDTGAPVPQGAPDVAPAAPVPQGDAGAPRGNVVSLDAAAHASAHDALVRVHAQYGTAYGSWAELEAGVSLSLIERELKIGKRRMKKAFEHAETVLSWADAQAAGGAEATA
jgi:hypothetical protein